MADRMDIDALLISALYGELTPADEARLTAHFESHPADRTALADLTHTRTAVRESRILAVQLEPPQSVSALLLQEAARRAPRPARQRDQESWLHRFLRSFTAHPAMAAAMTLVLIVGVASTLYVRRADQFGETPAPAVARGPASPEASSIAPAEPAVPSAAAPSAAPDPAAPGRFGDSEKTGNAAVAGRGAAAGSGSYRVGLDEIAPQTKAVQEQRLAKQEQRLAKEDAAAVPTGRAEPSKFSVADGEGKAGFAQAPAHAASESPPAKRAKKGAGIELQRPELQPKDLDDDDDRKRVARPEPRDHNEVAANDRAQGGPGGVGGGGGATASAGMIAPKPQAAPPPPAAPAAPAAIGPSEPEVATIPRNAPSNGAKDKAASPARDSRRFDRSAAPTPEPKADARAELKSTEERSAEDKALIGWAQKQRDQVIAYVRSNNCRAAASTANEIYNRAPEYYASNVEIDRTIKPCLAYLHSERERSDRVKAASKRANAADTPAQAAPQAAPPPARK
jgi:hypothetical protein